MIIGVYIDFTSDKTMIFNRGFKKLKKLTYELVERGSTIIIYLHKKYLNHV